MKIEKGQPAPDFLLHDTDKKPVSLTELRTKGQNLLLLFFPLAFTSTCTKELCSVRDNIAVYNDANAMVFGISVDAPQTLSRFKQEQGLNFPLLSDFNKEASASYGCLYDVFAGWMKGVSKRAAFVIDKQGVIQYSEILDIASEIPDFDRIQKILADLP